MADLTFTEENGSYVVQGDAGAVTLIGDTLQVHSKLPLYDEEPATQSCQYTDRGPCWTDSSSLSAKRIHADVLRGAATYEDTLRRIYDDEFGEPA